jgi:hypothetical protein
LLITESHLCLKGLSFLELTKFGPMLYQLGFRERRACFLFGALLFVHIRYIQATFVNHSPECCISQIKLYCNKQFKRYIYKRTFNPFVIEHFQTFPAREEMTRPLDARQPPTVTNPSSRTVSPIVRLRTNCHSQQALQGCSWNSIHWSSAKHR